MYCRSGVPKYIFVNWVWSQMNFFLALPCAWSRSWRSNSARAKKKTVSDSPLSKKWKPGSRGGACSVKGSFGGGGGKEEVETNARAPLIDPIIERTHPRPRFPLILKVGCTGEVSGDASKYVFNRLFPCSLCLCVKTSLRAKSCILMKMCFISTFIFCRKNFLRWLVLKRTGRGQLGNGLLRAPTNDPISEREPTLAPGFHSFS